MGAETNQVVKAESNSISSLSSDPHFDYQLVLLLESHYLYILSGDGVGAGVCSVTVIMGFGRNARSGLLSGASVDIPQYLYPKKKGVEYSDCINKSKVFGACA